MRLLAALFLLCALAFGQTTTLTGNGQQSNANGTLSTVAVAVTFHEVIGGHVSAIVNVGGCSAALNLPISGNGIYRYYRGEVEACGQVFQVSILLGHDEGPISNIGWSGGGAAGQATVGG